MLDILFPDLKRPLVGLAPMAGVSDPAMRQECLAFGADFTVSEMVSAKAITMLDQKSLRLLKKGGHGGIYGVQIFAPEADIAAEAVKMLDGDFDFIDINMGCPAPKITGNGSGSALLMSPETAGDIAKAVVGASNKPVSVKMRIGWDEKRMTGVEVAKRCEDAGVSMLCVHARTRREQYGPVIHPDEVAAINEAVSIDVLYNGDVNSGSSALSFIEQTGCKGVEVGRAAMGSPWVFEDILSVLRGGGEISEPPLSRKMRILDSQITSMCAWYGEEGAMRMGRGVAAQYMKGLKGASSLRRQAVTMRRYADLACLIENVYEADAERRLSENY